MKPEVPVTNLTARMELSLDGITPLRETRFGALKRKLGPPPGRDVLVSLIRKFLSENPNFSEQEIYHRKPKQAQSA